MWGGGGGARISNEIYCNFKNPPVYINCRLHPLRKFPIGIPIGKIPIGIPIGTIPIGIFPTGIPIGKIPIGIFPTGIPIEI